MSVLMSDPNRVKMNLDVDPVLREAVRLRASKLRVQRRREVAMHEVVSEILRRELAAEIAELESGPPIEDEEPPVTKKRGRPQK
jgi:hypothetical protein